MEAVQAPTLLLKADRDKRPYRLRCRFQIDPYPSRQRLDYEKVRIAERFVADMRKQGWVHDVGSSFQMTGPYPKINPIMLHPRCQLSARQMLWGVKEGQRFRDDGLDGVQMMPRLEASEYWEFELASIFVRPEVQVEVPAAHEERGST